VFALEHSCLQSQHPCVLSCVSSSLSLETFCCKNTREYQIIVKKASQSPHTVYPLTIFCLSFTHFPSNNEPKKLRIGTRNRKVGKVSVETGTVTIGPTSKLSIFYVVLDISICWIIRHQGYFICSNITGLTALSLSDKNKTSTEMSWIMKLLSSALYRVQLSLLANY